MLLGDERLEDASMRKAESTSVGKSGWVCDTKRARRHLKHMQRASIGDFGQSHVGILRVMVAMDPFWDFSDMVPSTETVKKNETCQHGTLVGVNMEQQKFDVRLNLLYKRPFEGDGILKQKPKGS